MRDPFTWSLPIGHLAGITVRLHILMPLVIAALVLREAFGKDVVAYAWADAVILAILLFLTVLLHELGHCFVGRAVGGEAREILLWPLGGLAAVEVPHAPAAYFWTALGGPLVNVALCAGSALALAFGFEQSWQPPWNALPPSWGSWGGWYPYRESADGTIALTTWAGEVVKTVHPVGTVLLARLFYVSWITLVLNLILIGFPFDSGRLLQACLWPRLGYRPALLAAAFTGFGVMFCLIVLSIWMYEPLVLLLAFYTYTACKQEWINLVGGNEDSLFGYDFSQGYTSLEKEPPHAPRKKRQNFLQRWLEHRRQLRHEREQQRRAADERRMDQLLQKIVEHGKQSLTEEEHRFMKRVAERYKNRP